MNLEPDEQAVICSKCNAYLWATYNPDSSFKLIDCPYGCKETPDGRTTTSKPIDEGRYGRS